MSIEYPAGFDPATMRNKPICGVLAVAIAANVSYSVAHAACKRNKLDIQKRFGGRTYKQQRDNSLTGLGISFMELPSSYLNMFIIEFCNLVKDDGFVYLIEVRGHVLTFKNGFLIDQGSCKPWQQYHRPRVKARRILRILGSAWPTGD